MWNLRKCGPSHMTESYLARAPWPSNVHRSFLEMLPYLQLILVQIMVELLKCHPIQDDIYIYRCRLVAACVASILETVGPASFVSETADFWKVLTISMRLLDLDLEPTTSNVARFEHLSLPTTLTGDLCRSFDALLLKPNLEDLKRDVWETVEFLRDWQVNIDCRCRVTPEIKDASSCLFQAELEMCNIGLYLCSRSSHSQTPCAAGPTTQFDTQPHDNWFTRWMKLWMDPDLSSRGQKRWVCVSEWDPLQTCSRVVSCSHVFYFFFLDVLLPGWTGRGFWILSSSSPPLFCVAPWLLS